MTDDMQGLDQARMVVMSLKPRFAEAILSGDKSVELRRTAPKIIVPTRALLYATTPVQALVGTCIVTSVVSAKLSALWREYGSCAAVFHEEFVEYFEGVSVGTALTLTDPQRFGEQVPLREMRAHPAGFRPPQSFAYVDTRTGDRLIQTAA